MWMWMWRRWGSGVMGFCWCWWVSRACSCSQQSRQQTGAAPVYSCSAAPVQVYTRNTQRNCEHKNKRNAVSASRKAQMYSVRQQRSAQCAQSGSWLDVREFASAVCSLHWRSWRGRTSPSPSPSRCWLDLLTLHSPLSTRSSQSSAHLHIFTISHYSGYILSTYPFYSFIYFLFLFLFLFHYNSLLLMQLLSLFTCSFSAYYLAAAFNSLFNTVEL